MQAAAHSRCHGAEDDADKSACDSTEVMRFRKRGCGSGGRQSAEPPVPHRLQRDDALVLGRPRRRPHAIGSASQTPEIDDLFVMTSLHKRPLTMRPQTFNAVAGASNAWSVCQVFCCVQRQDPGPARKKPTQQTPQKRPAKLVQSFCSEAGQLVDISTTCARGLFCVDLVD